MDFIFLLQVIGVIIGIAGTLLNSWQTALKFKVYALAIWTISNLVLALWSYLADQQWLMLMYVVYFAISLWGLERHAELRGRLLKRGVSFKDDILVTYNEK